MEKAATFRVIMNGLHRGHPAEAALERFLMNQSQEEELEIIESHILACEACVTRLENLEMDLLAMKAALHESLQQDQAKKLVYASTKSDLWVTLFKRFSWQNLSLGVGTLAACAATLTFVYAPRDVNVSAFRGSEACEVSTAHPLRLHLDAQDLVPGVVNVQVLTEQGIGLWKGSGVIKSGQIVVDVPRLASAGNYLVRVSAANVKNDGDSLIREFSLHAHS